MAVGPVGDRHDEVAGRGGDPRPQHAQQSDLRRREAALIVHDHHVGHEAHRADVEQQVPDLVRVGRGVVDDGGCPGV